MLATSGGPLETHLHPEAVLWKRQQSASTASRVWQIANLAWSCAPWKVSGSYRSASCARACVKPVTCPSN